MTAKNEINHAIQLAQEEKSTDSWGLILQYLQRKRHRLKTERRPISDQERKDTVNAIKIWLQQKPK